MDVVFLAYANSQQAPLPSLSKEDDGVFSVLVNRALKGHFFIHRDSFTTLDKINEYLGKYSDRLAVFLYSGHAGGDVLNLAGADANAKGIAHQLGESARKGKLRIVILNGCSTAGQVKGLLDAGVPVVVATSAPVDDRSAAEFSIRFFRCLSEKRQSIREAFEEALGPAQTATSLDLKIKEMPRGIDFREPADPARPLWGLFCAHPEALEDNPLPQRRSRGGNTDFEPNEKLTQVLFETLRAAENRDITNLHEKEEAGEYVELGDKQTAIVNVLPFPVSTHLQKLLCPVEQENEGFDKISLVRLEQIGTAFHTTLEFLTFILLAQLWEWKLKQKTEELPADLTKQIHDYFYLPPGDRADFDHVPFIRAVLSFQKEGRSYFVEEMEPLNELFEEGNEFYNALAYLTNLRRQAVAKNLQEEDVAELCQEAEDGLCDFFSQLGFLHRYILTSIQNIDIQKYGGQLETVFSHDTVKLMRAFGKPEQNHYLLPNYLDNRGVVLLKGRMRVVNAQKRQFAGEGLKFLNLSPFVIDRNAFETNTDLANLLFFDHYRQTEGKYTFKMVKRPERQRDQLEVEAEGPFEIVHLQLEAFRKNILNET